MKIQGSSKIVSPEIESKKQQQEAKFDTIMREAEVIDLIHDDVEMPKSRIRLLNRKVKDVAQKLVEKAKPYAEKQKESMAIMVTKFRELSPHADKFVTVIDRSIAYIANPNPLDDRSEVVQDTRPPAIFGIWVMIVTFGFFMMWAILAPLDSATHAMGKIILDSKKRIIQHPDGGIIKEILVKDGQEVTKGQALIILDDTQIKAAQQQHEYRYFASLAEVTRLTAEKDDLTEIKFPEELLAHVGDPVVQKLIQTQEKLFNAKQVSYLSKVDHAQKSTAQYLEQKQAVLPQIEANAKITKIAASQVESYRRLYKNKNISISYLQEAESNYADAVGRGGALKGQLAEIEQRIIQSQIALENFKNEQFEKTVQDLKEQQNQLSINSEALKAASESLLRTVITAPEAGNVSNLSDALTPRGVISPHGQQPLMEIIPQDDELVIEAKIPAQDIAAVKVGQTSRVRLTAYRARIVPALDGKLVSLSADLIYPDQRDMQMGQGPYYKARIIIDKDQLALLANLNDVALYPGMGVDVMIVVGTRTMMKYLMDPITLTLDHAFRER